MRTIQLKTDGFIANKKMIAYRTIFPKGHPMGNDFSPVVRFFKTPWTPIKLHGEAVEPLDQKVKTEEVLLVFPKVFEGHSNEPRLVEATPQRALGRAEMLEH